MKARDLISSALRTVGIISSGETPSAAEASDGLSVLNMMIESWSADNLSLFQLKREVFELVPNKGEYTVGIGADFNTSRPMTVLGAAYGTLIKTPIFEQPPTPEDDPLTPEDESAVIPDPIIVGYSLSSNFEIPMEILPYQKWMGISLKQTPSTIPTEVYVHGGAPFEMLSFWPVPSETCAFVMYSQKELTQFPDLDEEIDFPPGYSEALKYNLAVRIGTEYGREISPRIDKLASDSLAKIKVKNSRTPIMKNDVMTGCRNPGRKLSNIFSGGG